jgi:DNA adenine methylase
MVRVARAEQAVGTGGRYGLVAAIGARPRPIQFQLDDLDHPGASARYLSPLRYPGAKAGLNRVLQQLLANADALLAREVDLLVEPFAGGASASLHMLANGAVKRALLADADPMVSSFWQVAAAQTEPLIARMMEEHHDFVAPGGVTALDRWDYWKRWTPRAGMRRGSERFELAVKCLFLNRTTFSGILHGRAGPLGGRSQASIYTIGCRFPPDALAERLRLVGHLYDTGRIVDVWCSDWRVTLDEVASRYKTLLPDNVVAYLDPPYFEKSQRLYALPEASTGFDHVRLAEYLRESAQYRWILSYDHHPELLQASHFGFRRMRSNPLFGVHGWPVSKRLVTLNYTASSGRGRGPKQELLLTTLPPSAVPVDGPFQPVPAVAE